MTFFATPLDDDANRDLGRYTAAWSQLDYLVTLAVAHVVSGPAHTVSQILGEATAGTKIGALRRLVKLLPDGDQKTLGQQIVKTAFALNDQRNAIMHGLWVSYAPNGEVPYTAAVYTPTRMKLIEASKLGAMTAEISTCTDQLGLFIQWDQNLNAGAGQRIIAMGFGPPEGNYTADAGSAYFDLQQMGFPEPEG